MYEVVFQGILSGLISVVVNFWYLILLIVLVALYNLFKPVIKGYLGEKLVSVVLRRLNKEEYKIINDIILFNEDNKTTQIDHIIVSVYGIFVIETKNYNGWIIGKESDKYWKQVIFRTKNNFYNPLRQNYGHTMAVRSVIGDNSISIIPIVVFSNNATLKVQTHSHVVYVAKLLKTVKQYNKKCMSQEEAEKYYNMLSKASYNEKGAKAEHVRNIRKSINDNNAKCPKCGAELTKRSGRYGDFYGCTKYPRCRFTRSV